MLMLLNLIKLIKRGKLTLKHFAITFIKVHLLFLKMLRMSYSLNGSLISLKNGYISKFLLIV
jgi:hypothetical protein